MRASSADPHAGHVSPIASMRPQWWQCSAASPCSVSATSQFGQRRVAPHARQCTAGAMPRRFRSRIALPLLSTILPSSARSGAESGYPACRRRSTTRTDGIGAASRPPSSSRSSDCHDSGRGVAEPNTATAPSSAARFAATVRASYRGSESCLYDASCSSSTQMTPSDATGAKTAERAPMTTGASPDTMRSRSSRRSASLNPECRTATRSPNRSRKRPSACGVSAISGTSTIAPRPRPSAAWHARMYTSVLPLPVEPQRRTLPPPASISASMRPSAASCGGDNCVGAASASIAWPTVRRSPRRFGYDGATSPSARAGVDP